MRWHLFQPVAYSLCFKGTTIQATAWREAADALFPVFEDGKVRCVGSSNVLWR